MSLSRRGLRHSHIEAHPHTKGGVLLSLSLPGRTFHWMSAPGLPKAYCSLLLPEEGALIWLYTYPRAGSDCLWLRRRRSSTGRSTMMESGTRSVDSHFSSWRITQSPSRRRLNVVSLCMCMLPVGHFQFGEEEISIGCRWHQSPGWSADQCRVDVHAALCVTCVPGQCPRVPPQRAEGKTNESLGNVHPRANSSQKKVSLYFIFSRRPFRGKVCPAASGILERMVHQCRIQPQTTVPAPALKDRRKEGPILQEMDHMSSWVSPSDRNLIIWRLRWSLSSIVGHQQESHPYIQFDSSCTV